MEDKLQNASFIFADPGTSTDGTLDLDYSMLITAPNQFFPSLKRVANEIVPVDATPVSEGGAK
jgi:hypothetical protein